jgi:Zn-finger nucleic acid-binding protein
MCPATLEPQQVDDAVIDLCPACGGLWIDWFDGDLVDLTKRAPSDPGSPSQPSARAAAGACPRCRRPLDRERFIATVPEIHRCSECVGAFVTRDARDAILEHRDDDAEPIEDGAFARLIAALKRFFAEAPR